MAASARGGRVCSEANCAGAHSHDSPLRTVLRERLLGRRVVKASDEYLACSVNKGVRTERRRPRSTDRESKMQNSCLPRRRILPCREGTCGAYNRLPVPAGWCSHAVGTTAWTAAAAEGYPAVAAVVGPLAVAPAAAAAQEAGRSAAETAVLVAAAGARTPAARRTRTTWLLVERGLSSGRPGTC